MSVADVLPARTSPRPALLGRRFLASEIGMVLRRRRNQLVLLALLAIPVIIGVAVKLTTQKGDVSGGGLIGGITNNGIFVACTALVVGIPVFLPMVVGGVGGGTVSGEANAGTGGDV